MTSRRVLPGKYSKSAVRIIILLRMCCRWKWRDDGPMRRQYPRPGRTEHIAHLNTVNTSRGRYGNVRRTGATGSSTPGTTAVPLRIDPSRSDVRPVRVGSIVVLIKQLHNRR